jgi:hypothetical protein
MTTPQADKIVNAITEAIIASQGGWRSDRERDASYACVDTTVTLEALAQVAARIAFQTKIADTAAKGDVFAEGQADRISRTLKALRKSRDKYPFAPSGRAGSAWRKTEQGDWMTSFFVTVDQHERV